MVKNADHACVELESAEGRVGRADLTKLVYVQDIYLCTNYYFIAPTLPGLIQSHAAYTHTNITTLTLSVQPTNQSPHFPQL